MFLKRVVERTLPHLIYVFIYILCILLLFFFFFFNNSESILAAVRFSALFATTNMMHPLSNKIQFSTCIFKSRISVLNYFYTRIVSVQIFFFGLSKLTSFLAFFCFSLTGYRHARLTQINKHFKWVLLAL